MTAAVVVTLACGIYVIRLTGMFALSPWLRRPGVDASLRLVPVSVIAGVVALQVMTQGNRLALDARIVGAAVAAIAVWRKLPLAVVLVVSALATAAVRAVGILD